MDCDLSGTFRTLITHRINHHKHEMIAIHRKVLHEQSGKKVRQDLEFGYIPADLAKNGLSIEIDDDNEDIDILISIMSNFW